MQSFLRTPYARVLGEPEHRASAVDELPNRTGAGGPSMNPEAIAYAPVGGTVTQREAGLGHYN